MSWAVGYDEKWKRDIGYGVPAFCDHPGCNAEIDRGLAYVCCGCQPYGGENGCGRYFCSEHERFDYNEDEEPVCAHDPEDTHTSPDHPDWILHKLNDPTWKPWRDENPSEVERLKAALAGRTYWQEGGGE